MCRLKRTPKKNPYLLTTKEKDALEQLEVEICFSAEMDEFWSFVGNKSNQRWTWYALERHSGIILAWHNGKRQDKDFWSCGKCWLNFLSSATIRMIGARTQNIFPPPCTKKAKTRLGR
jgi:hypothetical protein